MLMFKMDLLKSKNPFALKEDMAASSVGEKMVEGEVGTSHGHSGGQHGADPCFPTTQND